MNHIFITGMLRSGTTLLDKVLNSHPDISVLSQPYTDVMLQPKRDFHNQAGLPENTLPLNHFFCEKRYTPEDVTSFLDTYIPDKEKYELILAPTVCHDLAAECLWDNDLRFHSLLGHLYRQHSESLLYTGAKEVLCEEYLPYFLSSGFKTLIIIRDPRDVITSMNYGHGEQHVGLYRPILFNIRNWRKSVAFALHLEEQGGFMFLKYEDLVRQPAKLLGSISRFLEISNFPENVLRNQLIAEDGRLWEGNSSFEHSAGISDRSIGRYQDCLPDQALQYIESACFPEMRYLGYNMRSITSPEYSIFSNYDERELIKREEFPDDYSSNDLNVKTEIKRLKLLDTDNARPDDISSFYLFEDTYHKLRSGHPAR